MSAIDPDQEGRGDRIGMYVGKTCETMTVDLIAVCKMQGVTREELLTEIYQLWDRVRERDDESKEESKNASRD